MATVLEMAEAIRQAAGWSKVPRAVDGSVEFLLEGGASFKLTGRGESLALFSADLGPWPQDEAEADRLARRLARISAGVFGRRSSVVSVAFGRYGLHLSFDPKQASLDVVSNLCAGFLNDLDWWRLNGDRP